MRIRDWSSDVCSSDLVLPACAEGHERSGGRIERACPFCSLRAVDWRHRGGGAETLSVLRSLANVGGPGRVGQAAQTGLQQRRSTFERSEEHTSELQSLMRISYAVFCLKKNKKKHIRHYN